MQEFYILHGFCVFLQVPNVTYREAILLIVVVPVHVAVVVVHVPVTGVVRIVLGRTPPVTVVAPNCRTIAKVWQVKLNSGTICISRANDYAGEKGVLDILLI